MRTRESSPRWKNAAMKNSEHERRSDPRCAGTDSLQGNMREIIGTSVPEGASNDRGPSAVTRFRRRQKDMNALGIWIESCNIQKIEDEKQPDHRWGQDNMSQIQKDALPMQRHRLTEMWAIARAQAQKDANDAQVIAETEITRSRLNWPSRKQN